LNNDSTIVSENSVGNNNDIIKDYIIQSDQNLIEPIESQSGKLIYKYFLLLKINYYFHFHDLKEQVSQKMVRILLKQLIILIHQLLLIKN